MLPNSILAKGVLAPNSKAEPSAKGTPVRMRASQGGEDAEDQLARRRRGIEGGSVPGQDLQADAGFCQGSRQLRWMWPRRRGDARSCGFEEAQHGHGPAKEEQSAAVGGDKLVVAGAKAEEVAELVVTAAEPGG
jgi:hypothetical protein